MFSHVMLGSNDMEASKKFYDATLSVLGIPEAVQDPKGRVFYRSATGTFGLSIPINGEPATVMAAPWASQPPAPNRSMPGTRLASRTAALPSKTHPGSAKAPQ
jgi:catechol 2,3-dioxygenase-like lactoylglutathione lyase family enzyme